MALDLGVARPSSFGTRSAVLLSLLIAAVLAFFALGLDLRALMPHDGGVELAGRFFSRALSPALAAEADFVPLDAPPLLLTALRAAATTVAFAAAAMSLAIVIGLLLGFLATRAWGAPDLASPDARWARSLASCRAARQLAKAKGPKETHRGSRCRPRCKRRRHRGPRWVALARRTLAPAVWTGARTLIALLRSVHEILWAILFTAALGLSDVAALLAIALPYGGTLAKIYAELIDEAPRDVARALRTAGASGVQTFCFGLVPRALPDMVAYTFYRFECAVRSSAVLGFFGLPTLGLYIHQSFKSGNYGEVWTFLYALLATVIVLDAWSGALRRRLVT